MTTKVTFEIPVHYDGNPRDVRFTVVSSAGQWNSGVTLGPAQARLLAEALLRAGDAVEAAEAAQVTVRLVVALGGDEPVF
jgi:hypothetical protein